MIQVIALLFANKDNPGLLQEYEARMIPIIGDYRGRVVSASSMSNPGPDDPDEVHVLQFDSYQDLEAYRADPRHAPLMALRQQAIRETRVIVTDRFITYLD